MRNIKPTVTIGIPAHNEEANIDRLLQDIFSQKGDFDLEKIVVACDGCTDRTAEVAMNASAGHSAVHVIDDKKRRGKMARLNELYSSTASDVLVTLDADIRLNDKDYLEKLVLTIVDENADLVSNRLVPLQPRSFIERVLYVSVCIKNEIIEEFRRGDNIFTCHGPCLAYSRRCYEQLVLPRVISEDAFAYIWAKTSNLNYRYRSDATIYYRLPGNLSDHEKQSVRFFHGIDELSGSSYHDWIGKYYKFPLKLAVKKTLKHLIRHPIEVAAYMLIRIYMKFKSLFEPKEQITWKIAESTRIV